MYISHFKLVNHVLYVSNEQIMSWEYEAEEEMARSNFNRNGFFSGIFYFSRRTICIGLGIKSVLHSKSFE